MELTDKIVLGLVRATREDKIRWSDGFANRYADNPYPDTLLWVAPSGPPGAYPCDQAQIRICMTDSVHPTFQITTHEGTFLGCFDCGELAVEVVAQIERTRLAACEKLCEKLDLLVGPLEEV